MTSPDGVDERRARALELRLAGATYDAIARAVGYASRSGAHKAVREALDAHDGAGHADGTSIDTELARLDAMLTGLWPKARRGDVAAVDRVLRIGERRMALLSADHRDPQKAEEVPLVDELASRRRTLTEDPGTPHRRRKPG